MLVTSADLWDPAPGRVLTFDVAPGSAGVPVSLSLNQHNHLALASLGEPSVWMAAAFDVDGAIDVDALGRAFRDLVGRHSSLQVAASTGPTGGVRHDPSRFTWTPRRHPCAGDTATLLRRLITERCSPATYPSFLPAAISRRERSTVLLAMDHLHTDAYSSAVVVEELATLYEAHRGRRTATLPEVASFVDLVEREAAHPVQVWPDDDRLRAWHAFIRRLDFTMPTFPLDLGVGRGERAPQATVVEQLAGPEDASTYAVLLAALGRSITALGGPGETPIVLPVHTRSDEAARNAIGWFTTNVPLLVGHDPVRLAADLKTSLKMAQVPLDQVLTSLPEPLRRHRADVFMVSYLDYRKLPGHAHAVRRNAAHVSAPTLADDLQLWLSRTATGLHVRARMPGTDVARRTVADLLEAWRAQLGGAGPPT